MPAGDIFSGLAFLILLSISEHSNRCGERETQSERAKAISSFCLTLWLNWQCDSRPLACALGQTIPAVLTLGCTQLFSRCLAHFPWVMPSLNWLLAGQSKDNAPETHWAILEATIGWIKGGNSVFSISLAREGNKYLTTPEDANNKVQ